MSIKLFIDMDGVLAVWDTAATLQDTHQPGYFLGRDIEICVKELILRLSMNDDIHVCINSAAYNYVAENEKDIWIDIYVDETLDRIFVPYGADKSDYVSGTDNILIDDHTDNLLMWQASGKGRAIKFLNGINGKSGRWAGPTISKYMTVEEMIAVIKEVAA